MVIFVVVWNFYPCWQEAESQNIFFPSNGTSVIEVAMGKDHTVYPILFQVGTIMFSAQNASPVRSINE